MIAIKLSHALELTHDEFISYNLEYNNDLQIYTDKATKEG